MENVIFSVARKFGVDGITVESLTDGLIHQTFKVTSFSGYSIVLQQVNTHVFADAGIIVENYRIISDCLKHQGSIIPAMLKTTDGKNLWVDNTSNWRAFEYIENSHTENLPAAAETIFNAAQCYGAFVKALRDIDLTNLRPTIAGFHDLNNRYKLFQHAIKSASEIRLKKSKVLMEKIESRTSLVKFYDEIVQNPKFKIRAMHHDCKLSNILFDKKTKSAICPIAGRILDRREPAYPR